MCGAAGLARANPYIVVDVNTQRVISADEPFKRWYPASLAKLMTAYLVFEDMQAGRLDPQAPITFSASAANEPASKMYFAPGTRVTVDSALKMMLVHSANDAARAVAEHAIGGRQAFVNRMNDTAGRLGMTDTHFVNANGMDAMNDPQPGQYTTVRDMAVLAIAIEKSFPEYLYYFTIPGIATDSGKYRNTNLLIGNFDGAMGMKTGFVCSSGYNQVSFAKRNGREVVAVAFGAPSAPARAEKAAELLEAGLKASGGSGPKLDDYLPPPAPDRPVADVTSQICSAEAAANRVILRDADGNLMFSSPYLRPLRKDYPTVDAYRLPNDTEMAANTLEKLTSVPLPYARPAQ
nr:D-alanyl-D-alanine carboxypeptidase family protein [Marinicella sp. W31]MDC2875697.1 D-alanyl-D-alanine carboxypeptidase [Marinicella sp. W31]